MIAKLEKGYYNIYKKNENLFSSIKIQSNFKSADIKVGDRTIKLKREKWHIKVFEDNKVICNLKRTPVIGSIKVLESSQKIMGARGLKWGTKMVDKENQTLLKIKHDNQIFNNNKYEIEISSDKVSDIDITLALYAHLYGSKVGSVIAIVIAFIIWVTLLNTKLFNSVW